MIIHINILFFLVIHCEMSNWKLDGTKQFLVLKNHKFSPIRRFDQ